MCLGSGALLDFAVAPYEGKETGEQALIRKLLYHLRIGDILLGDANFENHFFLAMVLQAKADVVFEKNGSRIIDFKKCCQKLGNKDGLFKLKRPAKPEWMRQELYDPVFVNKVVVSTHAAFFSFWSSANLSGFNQTSLAKSQFLVVRLPQRSECRCLASA